MMQIISFSVAIAGSIIASYTDVKSKTIPNTLTFPMIGLGLFFSSFKIYFGKNLLLLAILIISYFIVYIIWRAGLWGGGDAKLVLAIMLLISPFSNMFVSYFFISIALVLLIHFFIFGLMEEIRRKEVIKFSIMVLCMLSSALFAYFISLHFFPSASIFAMLFASFIVGDIASSFLPCKKTVPLSDSIVGEPLAETIGMKNGKIVRIEKEPSIILGMLKRKEKVGEVIVSPHYLGLSKEDIEKLKKYCKEVKIFITYPMAPLILVSLLISIALEMVGFGIGNVP